MAISELQLGLIGVGVAAVVGVLAYNKWQERKAQKHAEKTFRSEHRDVLFEPVIKDEDGPPMPAEETGGNDFKPAEPVESVPRPAPAAPADVGRKAPGLPAEVNEQVDCVLRIEAIEPMEAGRLWQAQQAELDGLSKPVGWFAFDEAVNAWVSLDKHGAQTYHWFCAAMQMVDRRGPINDADFTRFTEGVQRLADQFMAVTAAPVARAEALGRAAELDRFCASVDVQIGINLVSRGTPFPGTKLRGLVEAQGMSLRGDGLFHAEDDEGNTLFVLGNLEPNLLTAESMRTLQTQGLTMIVDVPRVAEGAQVFDRMMVVARQLAEALNADLVDDNRSPFGAEAAKMIRGQIQHFQKQMHEYGLPAGSGLALRLFAA